MTFERVLVTGAAGQIGSELVPYFSEVFGKDRIVPSDVKPNKNDSRSIHLDVTNSSSVNLAIEKYRIDTIFHLAAILSAAGEKNPELAYKVNVEGLHNVLDAGVKHEVGLVVVPSSIGVFGPDTQKENVPIEAVTRPVTIYGITKVMAEQLGNYYHSRLASTLGGSGSQALLATRRPPAGGRQIIQSK